MLSSHFRLLVAIILFALAALGARAQESRPSYDPLAVSADFSAQTLDLVVQDAERDREVPVLIYLPAAAKKAPIVLFSHGLGGSREGASYLGKHWAARGFVAVYLQHPGSDESVWKGKRLRERMPSMKKAASGENLLLRCGDVKSTLDQLQVWQEAEQHPLFERLDMDRIAMTGHSFGAVTTQWISGQTAGSNQSLGDERIKAAVLFSPSGARMGSSKQAFAQVKIPWLLMTGTKDVSPIGDISVAQRLEVFKALPLGPHYELVLDAAEHSAFSAGRGSPRLEHHHPAILALSTAFLEAKLLGSTAAATWLDGAGPRSVLKEKDSWKTKATKMAKDGRSD